MQDSEDGPVPVVADQIYIYRDPTCTNKAVWGPFPPRGSAKHRGIQSQETQPELARHNNMTSLLGFGASGSLCQQCAEPRNPATCVLQGVSQTPAAPAPPSIPAQVANIADQV